MATKKHTKKVISAEDIKKLWTSQAKGETPPDFATIISTANRADELQIKVNKLEEAAAKRFASAAGLRDRLAETLKKYGITAAFEPLIEMALERYPEDFKVEALRGMFVCSYDQRIKIWTEILQYQMPKLKAVEVSGEVDNSITVVIRRFGGDSVMEAPRMIQVPQAQSQVIEAEEVNPNTPKVAIKRF